MILRLRVKFGRLTPGVIKTMHNRANALKKEYGTDPLLLPFTMAPTGIDFATMPLDTMINYARQGMNKSNLKKMDQGIKKIIPEWLGVANPKSNEPSLGKYTEVKEN